MRYGWLFISVMSYKRGCLGPEVCLSGLWRWLTAVEVCVRSPLLRVWGAFLTCVRFLPSASLSGFLRVGFS